MNWKRVSIANAYMPFPEKEELRFVGHYKRKLKNKRVAGWRLKSGATFFVARQLDKEKRRIVEYSFLISKETFEAMNGISSCLNNMEYAEELEKERGKLCTICGERPATCMGKVCVECDHLLGDRGSNE